MILVMTACVKPARISQLRLVDAEERLKQYCSALHFYIQCKKFDKIVFCDNSDYFYEYDKELQLAKEKKVQLEILKFKSDYRAVEQYGKGYGEGEILHYVMLNSRLLETEDFFYKVTGRLIIRNIFSLINKKNKTALFNRNLYAYKSLDTRFWGMKKEEYIQYLLESYKKVNDNKGKYLEMVYKKDIEAAEIEYKSFRVFPLVKGYSGTIGEIYNETKWYTKIIYDFMCYFNLFNSIEGFCLAFVLYNVTIRKGRAIDAYYSYLIHNVD